MSNSNQYLTTLYDRVFNTRLASLQDILLWDARMLCKEQFNVRGLWNVGCFRIWGQAWISFYANNQRWYYGRSRYATFMHRSAQLRSMFLKSCLRTGKILLCWDAENLMCGVVQCSRSVEPRVFRCSPRSETQYASRLLCPFYINTNDSKDALVRPVVNRCSKIAAKLR